jgi:hypothetical protein
MIAALALLGPAAPPAVRSTAATVAAAAAVAGKLSASARRFNRPALRCELGPTTVVA